MKLTSGKLICSNIKWLDTINYDETVPVPAELPTRVELPITEETPYYTDESDLGIYDYITIEYAESKKLPFYAESMKIELDMGSDL